jgi:hypothetical protein
MASGDRATTAHPYACAAFSVASVQSKNVHLCLHRHAAARLAKDSNCFGVVLTCAKGPDLAFGQQSFTGRHHILGCNHGLGTAVQLIEIHGVQSEPAQASLTLGLYGLRADIIAAAGTPALIDAEAELGGHGDRLPHRGRQRGQRTPDDQLGVSGSVRGRGVDQRDACVKRRMQRADALRIVNLAPPGVATIEGERSAEGPRADTDGRQLPSTGPQRPSFGSRCTHCHSWSVCSAIKSVWLR